MYSVSVFYLFLVSSLQTCYLLHYISIATEVNKTRKKDQENNEIKYHSALGEKCCQGISFKKKSHYNCTFGYQDGGSS